MADAKARAEAGLTPNHTCTIIAKVSPSATKAIEQIRSRPLWPSSVLGPIARCTIEESRNARWVECVSANVDLLSLVVSCHLALRTIGANLRLA